MIRRFFFALSLILFCAQAALAQSSSLSNLPTGNPIAGTDLFYDVQTAGTGGVKVTGSMLSTYLFGQVSGNCFASSTGSFTCGSAAGVPPIATSTVLGNFSGSTAIAAQASVPSCASDGTHALSNPSGGGFNCTALSLNPTIAANTTLTTGFSAGQLIYSDGTKAQASGGITFTGTGQLALASGTVTASSPLLTLSQTWNAGGTRFFGTVLNITNTASAVGSIFADYQVAGTSQIALVASPASASRNQAVVFHYVPASPSGETVAGVSGGVAVGRLQSEMWEVFIGEVQGGYASNADSLIVGSFSSGGPTGGAIGFSPNFHVEGGGAPDTMIMRDAAGIIGQRNSTNAQGFRVYNTADTTLTNWEAGVFDWVTTTNKLTIGSQKGGTGTNRDVVFTSTSANFYLDAAGSTSAGYAFRLADVNTIAFLGGAFDTRQQGIDTNVLRIGSGNSLSFGGSSPDINISRGAAKVAELGDGSGVNANGWINWGGEARIDQDFSCSSGAGCSGGTTLTNITGSSKNLSVNVQAGRTYSFDAYLSFTDAAAGGIKAAIGGTATATAIEYDGWILDSGSNGVKGNTQATALATTVASATTTGTAGVVQIKGTITVANAGTLTVQMAQNTANATNTTVKRGSYFIVHDMP